jgi:hypothetical protein
MHLGLVGAEQILGHEDLANDAHSYTATCVSNDTVLFAIRKSVLMEVVQFHEDRAFEA